jgi:adenylate cyclase, class 2
MPVELEAKLKVDSHEPVRARLAEAGARALGRVLEVNTLYDDSANTLFRGDRGLRVREAHDEANGAATALITYKGPRQPGQFKSREEINLDVASASGADALLIGLGYRPVLRFQKRRESWMLDNCHVELDELPHLGLFVEIEGADEASIGAVRDRLGLTAAHAVNETYIAMLAEYCRSHGLGVDDIRFA